ncbi:MAG: 2-C-methyl-D-erythritol 4-phosphate cytidylyltransferase [Gammaproteobacteria bacterium]|nr:2-C-methyl-D-erythritol 4-phosphate cytidylyltransferase [Gammaproteobacteria bacterium]
MQADLPKQYLSINGKRILEYTLECFCTHPKIERVIVAIANQDYYWPELSIASHPKIKQITGGAERCHSVLNCLRVLETLADSDDWVLVHDAVRPCISREDIDCLIETLKEHPVGGLLALPVRDTMKRVDNHNVVMETVNRTGLWHALTPQMFRLAALTRALERALAQGQFVTDESQAIELTGLRPVLVQGRPENIKITHNNDLALAELYLK